MKKYQILDTENTRDFAFSLIGMTFEGEVDSAPYINLHTCDGDILFAIDEVEEVINERQTDLLKQLQEIVSKVYDEQQNDEVFKNKLSNISLYNKSLKECFEMVEEL